MNEFALFCFGCALLNCGLYFAGGSIMCLIGCGVCFGIGLCCID